MTITILVIIKTQFLSMIESIAFVMINIESNKSIIQKTKIPRLKDNKPLFNFLFFIKFNCSFTRHFVILKKYVIISPDTIPSIKTLR